MKTNEISADIVAKFRANLNEMHQLIFDLGMSSGLRISDIISITRDMLDIEKPTIHERKTGKPRRIYIPRKIREELIKYHEENGINNFIFGSESKSGHVSRQAVFKAFKKASERAGVVGLNIAPHSMRKSYACKLFESGHEIEYIQDKLNHSHEGDTVIYVKDSLDKIMKSRRRRP